MVILLIISPFHPAQTPNTIRWKAILNEFAKKGHFLHVLTTKWFPSPDEINSDSIFIHRIGHHSLLDRFYNLTKTKNRRNITTRKFVKPSFFRKLLELIVSKLWRNFYWPDGSVLFLKPGISKAKEIIKTYSVSHVISVGLPFTTHLIAQKVKENKNDLVWLMDIQDVFCFSSEFWVNNFKRYAQKNLEAEKKAFTSANAIAITNENALKRYMELFSFAKDKIAIIPPLFEFENIETERKFVREPSITYLAYYGSFYENVRSPKAFLEFLDQMYIEDKKSLVTICIHIYGEQSPFSLSLFDQYPNLKNYVILKGFKDRKSMFESIDNYDILLNFGNTTDYHLPSKIVEFLYFQKAVINIITRVDDLSKHFIEDKLELLNLNLHNEDFGKSRDEFLGFVYKKRDHIEHSISAVQVYLPKQIAHQYLELLDQ